MAMTDLIVHGAEWTTKELFVFPNEFIYWSIQIVMYPFMTGLVAGAFVLSSLYHVFGIKELKGMARFALVFSFALLFAAPMPIVLHLQHPFRGINVFMTPHFTSAIAAFGIVFFTYGAIVASELWFLYRKHFVEVSLALREKQDKTLAELIKYLIFCTLTLGSYDVSEEAHHRDEKAIKILAGVGIPVACFHFRVGQGECPLDDASHAGYFYHVGNRFRYCPLHADLYHRYGNTEGDDQGKKTYYLFNVAGGGKRSGD